MAGLAAGTAAGCTDITEQEFEAEPVGLSGADRDELVLEQVAGDASTLTREVDAVDGEVSITSYTTTYARGPARGQPTLLEKFLGRVNGTDGAGAAAVAAASDLGLEEVPFDLEGADYAPLPGDRVNFVAPAGLRAGQYGPLENGLAIAAVGEGTAYPAPRPDFVVPATEFFPGLVYDRGRKYDPMKQWLPAGDYPAPDNFLTEGTVGVALGDHTPEEVFGVSEGGMPGERLGEGDSFTGNNPFLVAAPGSVAVGGQSPFVAEDLYAAGVPAWAGGATYGLGVLSTPNASVAGESVNPVAGMDFEELLTSGQARGLLEQTGMTDADEVEWLAGPTPVSDVPDGTEFVSDSPDGTTILDRETPIESFLGVVGGEDGPWGVGIHAARVQHDRDGGTDVVVAAGSHRWPVPSGGGSLSEFVPWADGERFTGILGSIIDPGRTLTAEAGLRFYTGADDLI